MGYEQYTLDASNWHSLEEALDSVWPEWKQLYYPHRYVNVGQYSSPKLISCYLASVAKNSVAGDFEKLPNGYKLLSLLIAQMVPKLMPMLFLSGDMAEAVKRTTFADEIDWTEMHMPYEAFALILPKRALMHPVDGEVACVFVSRARAGAYFVSADKRRCRKVSVDNDVFTLIALCPYGRQPGTGELQPVVYTSHFTAKKRKTLKLGDMFYRDRDEEMKRPNLAPSSELDEVLTEKDDPFLEQLGCIAIGTLLVLNARPELLSKGILEKKIPAKKHEAPKEFWSPTVIGKHYRLPKEPQGGTHASPRMHWRRGHYRNQVCGIGRAERKQIWLEPTLVAAKEEETQNA